jgi:hypothetical protein
MFGVNATNSTTVSFDVAKSDIEVDGYWNLNYQKRVINASTWVNETLDSNLTVAFVEAEEGFLLGFGLFNPLAVIFGMIGVSIISRREDENN